MEKTVKTKKSKLGKMPYIETLVSKSKDGKFLIHKTVITHIRPVSYYEAVLDNSEEVSVEDIESLAQSMEA